MEAFYHGNVDHNDAEEAGRILTEALASNHGGLSTKKLPSKLVMKVKSAIEPHYIIVPTIDTKE